jgi:purine-nucleoside phosphorylase
MNETLLTLAEIDRAVEAIRSRSELKPEIGMILGSGLGGLADSIGNATSIAVEDIPGWPRSTVEGHAGLLVMGELEGKRILALRGRAHYYEGHSISRLGLPVRVMQRMGIGILVVTNAAGAVNPEFEPGDLMLISDHINFMGMAGITPLRGPNLDVFGPRFPDMSQAYDRNLQALAQSQAREQGILLRSGVYVCLAGPSFETPADLRFLRGIGADAVGMSTVPEVSVARQGGTRVLGISGISNKANLDGATVTTHEEVLAAGELIVPKLVALLRATLREAVTERSNA